MIWHLPCAPHIARAGATCKVQLARTSKRRSIAGHTTSWTGWLKPAPEDSCGSVAGDKCPSRVCWLEVPSIRKLLQADRAHGLVDWFSSVKFLPGVYLRGKRSLPHKLRCPRYRIPVAFAARTVIEESVSRVRCGKFLYVYRYNNTQSHRLAGPP